MEEEMQGDVPQEEAPKKWLTKKRLIIIIVLVVVLILVLLGVYFVYDSFAGIGGKQVVMP